MVWEFIKEGYNPMDHELISEIGIEKTSAERVYLNIVGKTGKKPK